MKTSCLVYLEFISYTKKLLSENTFRKISFIHLTNFNIDRIKKDFRLFDYFVNAFEKFWEQKTNTIAWRS